MMEQNNAQALEQAIMEIAQQEAQTLLEAAKIKADSILRQAEKQAQLESDRILEVAQQDVKKFVDQATSKARLEAQMLKLQRREQVLESAMANVRQQLPTIPERREYADIVRDLIREAATQLGEEAFVIEADAKTCAVLSEDFLNQLAEDLNVSLELLPQEESQTETHTSFKRTGIVLTTTSGHRRYDNTLEARLTRMQDELRTAVYHILAEDAPLAEGA